MALIEIAIDGYLNHHDIEMTVEDFATKQKMRELLKKIQNQL